MKLIKIGLPHNGGRPYLEGKLIRRSQIFLPEKFAGSVILKGILIKLLFKFFYLENLAAAV
jgi:hypothetical protein